MKPRLWFACVFAAVVLVIAGNNAVAESVRFAGGLSISLADTLYCKLTGCTMTGAVTFSGVTTDITAASAEDVVIAGGATSGSVVLRSIDNTTVVQASDSAIAGEIVTVAGSDLLSIQEEGGGGVVIWNAASVAAGSTAAIGDSSGVFLIGESCSTSTGTCGSSHFRIFGGGIWGGTTIQSSTCTDSGDGSPGALALTPTSSNVQITNSDAHGCVVTITDSNFSPGMWLNITVISNAGGVVTLADNANNVVSNAACDTTGMALNGTAECQLVDSGNDYFVCNRCNAP